MRDPTASAVWRKSSYSGVNGCVQVAFSDDGVAVRDSKQQHGAVLSFTATEWQAFLRAVRDGEFDLPDLAPRLALAEPSAPITGWIADEIS